MPSGQSDEEKLLGRESDGAAADSAGQWLTLLGTRLRRLRKERRLSQEDFALNAGLARTYYGEVERGERNVAAINLVKIALTLGVEVGDLFPPLAEIRAVSSENTE